MYPLLHKLEIKTQQEKHIPCRDEFCQDPRNRKWLGLLTGLPLCSRAISVPNTGLPEKKNNK